MEWLNAITMQTMARMPAFSPYLIKSMITLLQAKIGDALPGNSSIIKYVIGKKTVKERGGQ